MGEDGACVYELSEYTGIVLEVSRSTIKDRREGVGEREASVQVTIRR